LAHWSAEQFVDRHAERLALDVEQRVLDRRYGARVHTTGRLHLTHPERRSDLLHRPRVDANQRLGQGTDHARKAAATVRFGIFGPAGDAIIGGDLQEGKRAPSGVAMQIVDAGDLHGSPPALLWHW